MITPIRAEQIASSAFLTEEIPDEFFDWSDEHQLDFIKDHAFYPMDRLSPEEICELIENLAIKIELEFKKYQKK